MKIRRLTAVVLSIAMALSMTACGSRQTGSGETAKSGESGGAAAGAVSYPTKNITIIVPFDAGGTNDIMARLIAKVANEGGYFNGQDIIVENQPGGSGAIGQAYVANTAEPDGYTLLMFSSSTVSNTVLKDVPFTVDDFTALVVPQLEEKLLIVNKDAPYDDLDGFVEYARDHKIMFADDGFGSSNHINALNIMSKLQEQIDFTLNWESIHLDSGNMKATEVMGGHADIAMVTTGEGAELVKNGDIKAIALVQDERSKYLPELSTYGEQGYEGLTCLALTAVACNSKVDNEIKEYLQKELIAVCSSEEFVKAMTDANFNAYAGDAEYAQGVVDGLSEVYGTWADYIKAGQ